MWSLSLPLLCNIFVLLLCIVLVLLSKLLFRRKSILYLGEWLVVLVALGSRLLGSFPASAAVATVLADCCAFQPFASELQRQAKWRGRRSRAVVAVAARFAAVVAATAWWVRRKVGRLIPASPDHTACRAPWVPKTPRGRREDRRCSSCSLPGKTCCRPLRWLRGGTSERRFILVGEHYSEALPAENLDLPTSQPHCRPIPGPEAVTVVDVTMVAWKLVEELEDAVEPMD